MFFFGGIYVSESPRQITVSCDDVHMSCRVLARPDFQAKHVQNSDVVHDNSNSETWWHKTGATAAVRAACCVLVLEGEHVEVDERPRSKEQHASAM